MKELYVPLSGAIAQQKNVETIANNVANANTAGFKRDQLAFREYLTAMDKGVQDIDLPRKEWEPKDFYRSYGAENAQVKVDGAYTDFSQGELNPTGNHFDFGLHGEGFFEVLGPAGVRYTRKGSFSLNAQGQLVTEKGFPVLQSIPDGTPPEETPDPEERMINLGTQAKMSVNLQGDVFSGDQKVGRISVVEFSDQHALKKEGHSLFINNHPENLKRAQIETAVHQGFIEQSNVNAVAEMSNLIKANRNFESIQRVIKAYDNISAKGVNEISKF